MSETEKIILESKYKEIFVVKNKIGGYATIFLNRPKSLNSITNNTIHEICDALEEIELNRKIRCVVLRGTNKDIRKPAFSSGADLSQRLPKGLKMSVPMHMDYWMLQKHRFYDRIESFTKPLIAAVDGFAFGGGCELTLVCDLVIATTRSQFGFPEIKRGILPANGGTQRMIQHIGLARTKLMIYTGEKFSAKTLYDWGYVAQLCEASEFEETVNKLATTFGTGATTSYYVIKKCMNYGSQVPLGVGLKFEQMAFGIIATSRDVDEGIQAFMEKRPPKFRGK